MGPPERLGEEATERGYDLEIGASEMARAAAISVCVRRQAHATQLWAARMEST